jgi:hypothetical protein
MRIKDLECTETEHVRRERRTSGESIKARPIDSEV